MSNVSDIIEQVDEVLTNLHKTMISETAYSHGETQKADRTLDQIERVTVVRRNLIQMSNVEELLEIESRIVRVEQRLDNSVVTLSDRPDPTADEIVAAIDGERETGGSFEPDTIDE